MSKSDHGARHQARYRQMLDEYDHSRTGQTRAKRLAVRVDVISEQLADMHDDTPAFSWGDVYQAPECPEPDWALDWDWYEEDDYLSYYDEVTQENTAWAWYEHLRPTRQDMLCALGTCELCDACFPDR